MSIFDSDDEYTSHYRVPEFRFTAYCTSDDCRIEKKKNHNRTDLGIIKEVKKTVDVCPDCGHYLYWDRSPT